MYRKLYVQTRLLKSLKYARWNALPLAVINLTMVCLLLTSGRLDVVDGVAVEPHLGCRIGLFFLVAADGEGVLRYLHEDEVPLLPLLPDRLAHGVEIPAVFHVHGLVHPHSDF